MDYPKAEMKLTSSASEQNVFLTYVCTINEVNPRNEKLHTDSRTNYNLFEGPGAQDVNDDSHIKVERSKALHELVDAHAHDERSKALHELVDAHTQERVFVTKHAADAKATDRDGTTSFPSTSESEGSDMDDTNLKELNDNPNILKLTKMKWLTEERDGSPDSRYASLSPSPASSNTSSQYSRESETNLRQRMSFGDKYLSTILRLDKEHNLFGLSNIAIVGSRASRKVCKKDEKPVFHQTAIVQVCCTRACCKYRSNTDLPSKLKCGSCRTCCAPEYSICPSCGPCDAPICTSACSVCPKSYCSCKCKVKCRSSKCRIDCNNCFGLTLTLKRKPKYEPTYTEITPRSSCVQSLPAAARKCSHLPQCVPPSSCFPYLMPCYWPARPSAPCTAPTRCFHNPPCLPPRRPRNQVPRCKRPTCDTKKQKCTEPTCPGNIKGMSAELSRFNAAAPTSRTGSKHDLKTQDTKTPKQGARADTSPRDSKTSSKQGSRSSSKQSSKNNSPKRSKTNLK